jgi:hypothetical protein
MGIGGFFKGVSSGCTAVKGGGPYRALLLIDMKAAE